MLVQRLVIKEIIENLKNHDHEKLPYVVRQKYQIFHRAVKEVRQDKVESLR